MAKTYKWYKVKVRRPYSKKEAWTIFHVQAKTKAEARSTLREKGYIIVSVT